MKLKVVLMCDFCWSRKHIRDINKTSVLKNKNQDYIKISKINHPHCIEFDKEGNPYCINKQANS